jgi:hypothetical protein
MDSDSTAKQDEGSEIDEVEDVEMAPDGPARPIANLGFPDDLAAAVEFDPFEYMARLPQGHNKPETQTGELVFDPYAEAFAYGAVFTPGSADFERPRRDVAPPKPSYLELERTTYKTTRPLAMVKEHLKTAFPEVSFDWKESTEHPCGYECTAMQLLSRIELEVCIFSEGPAHLVEVRRLFGCPYAFSEAASDLAKQLKVKWVGSSAHFKMPFAPPPLPAGVALEPPPGFSGPVLTPEQYAAQACAQVLSLLSSESPRSMRLQGARAAGKFADDDTDGRLFAAGCPGVHIAVRLVELVQTEQAATKYPDAVLHCVAMGAIANIANKPHVCLEWSAGPVGSVIIKGITDNAAHVGREALHAAVGLMNRGISKEMFKRIKLEIQTILDTSESPHRDANAVKYAGLLMGNLQ